MATAPPKVSGPGRINLADEFAGFDRLIIETVGVGQSEVEVITPLTTSFWFGPRVMTGGKAGVFGSPTSSCQWLTGRGGRCPGRRRAGTDHEVI
jgi:hypothetical protein